MNANELKLYDRKTNNIMLPTLTHTSFPKTTLVSKLADMYTTMHYVKCIMKDYSFSICYELINFFTTWLSANIRDN